MRSFEIAVPAGVRAKEVVRGVDPVTGKAVEVVMPEVRNDYGTVLTVQVPATTTTTTTTASVRLNEPSAVGRRRHVCDGECCGRCWCFCCAYAAVVAAFSGMAAALGPACLCCLAVSPAGPIWAFAERWYRKYITRCTLFDVALEAFLLLIVPLMIAITILDWLLPMRTSCDSSRSIPFGRYFFTAYVRAGLLEESLKYLAVRRQLFKAYVVDARALLVYAGWAGVVFGVLENIGYAFILPLGNLILRCFLTVPLHASTGIQIGANLVAFRFAPGAAPPPEKCGNLLLFHLKTFVTSTTAPILLHGSYNVLLFIASGECEPWTFALILVAYLGVVAQFIYIRFRLLQVETTYPADDDLDLHKLIEDGTIEPPCKCCCGGHGCCACCY